MGRREKLFRLLFFPILSISCAPYFYLWKCLWNFGFCNSKCLFLVFWSEKMNFSPIRISKSKHLKKYDMFLAFSDYKIRTTLTHLHVPRIQGKNSTYYIIQTVSTKILSMSLTWIAILKTTLTILALILVF